MAPFHPSFDGSSSSRSRYEQRHSYDAQDKHEEVIFSLTERLRLSEDEVRLLQQENFELKNQIRLGGSPVSVKLDAAYDELSAHLMQREASFHMESMKLMEQQRNLENEVQKLKDKAHLSRKLLDDQEKHISFMEKEELSRQKAVKSEGKMMQEQLDFALQEIDELKNEIQNLLDDIDHGKQREDEDREIIANLIERLGDHAINQDELEQMNEELQSRLETQRHLLREMDDELLHVERTSEEREKVFIDDIDRLNHRLNEIIRTDQEIMQENEEEMRLLYRQIDKYETILAEADYVTHEQRNALAASNEEIKSLSTAIYKVHNSGFLSQLDKMMACGTHSKDYMY
jgi:chromosome segregation ATPase